MTETKYIIFSAMDENELSSKVNLAMEGLNAKPVGGVTARGAQLLQAVLIETSEPDPEPEPEKKKTSSRKQQAKES